MLKRFELLDGAPAYFMNTLASSASITVFSPKQVIVKKGDTVRGTYFLCRGMARMLNNDGAFLRRIDQGKYFQDLAIFVGGGTVDHTVVAETYCEIYILTKTHFEKSGHLCWEGFDTFVENIGKKDVKRRTSVDSSIEMSQFVENGAGAWRREGSKFRKAFQVLEVCGLLIYLITLPLHLMAYYQGDAPYTPGLVCLILVLTYLADAVFVTDIILNITGAFTFTQDGAVVTDRTTIRRRYLRKWGFSDIVAAVPLEILAPAFGFGLGRMSVLRLNKMARASHLGGYFDIVMQRMLTGMGQIASNILKLFLTLVLVLHWVACVWLLVSEVSVLEGINSWVPDDHTASQLDLSHSEAGNFGGYLRSYYFAIVAMSTIGYGDIVPSNSPRVNLLESWMATIVVLFGGLLYPAIVGGLASFMMGLGGRTTRSR